MIIQPYTINDFSVGDSVVPVGLGSLTLVVVDIDRTAGKIICRLSEDTGRVEHVFSPGELEKEPIVHPPNIVDIKRHQQLNTETN
jgi:hypothetical protein